MLFNVVSDVSWQRERVHHNKKWDKSSPPYKHTAMNVNWYTISFHTSQFTHTAILCATFSFVSQLIQFLFRESPPPKNQSGLILTQRHWAYFITYEFPNLKRCIKSTTRPYPKLDYYINNTQYLIGSLYSW